MLVKFLAQSYAENFVKFCGFKILQNFKNFKFYRSDADENSKKSSRGIEANNEKANLFSDFTYYLIIIKDIKS